jgi:integrase
MLRPDTGWLRQNPHFAERLQAFSDSNDQYVSPDFMSRAQADWDGVCDAAIKEFKAMIEKIKPLVTVARDPFKRIEGLLDLDDPMEALGVLLQEMKRDLPNPHTQPVLYHTGIRDLSIIILLVVTGLRIGTLTKLVYTGDNRGHLYFEGGQYILSVPRTFFKNPDSSYFQTNRVKEDYLSKLPDVYGLNEIFKVYLETSRPFLMQRYHSQSKVQPLFITSFGTKSANMKPTSPRLKEEQIYRIYVKKVEKYLVENKHRGTGIHKVKRTGPHSVRHLRGTTVYRKTGSFKLAGDANQNSEQMARKHYSRSTTKERNHEVTKILF